jgi:hypothetical protein
VCVGAESGPACWRDWIWLRKINDVVNNREASLICVKGSIRAMTRGWVTPRWAWKHHRAWFREVTKGIQQR